MGPGWRASVLVLALLVAPLLVAPTAVGAEGSRYGAAEVDPDSVYAPLRVLLQGAPRVVDLAIAESKFDGTADGARSVAARMVSYASGLEDGTGWPDLASSPTLASLSFGRASALAEVVASIPPDIGLVERESAACRTWASNATVVEQILQAERAWPAFARLSAASSALTVMSAEFPPEAGAEDITRATRTLDAWLADSVAEAEACLPPAHYFALRLLPREGWPTSIIVAQGWASGNVTEVRLRAPTLGLDARVVPGDYGGFVHSFTVPRNATLGPHTVRARTSEGSAEVSFDVVRAPARLVLSSPAEVRPGAAFDVRARVVSPLASEVGEGPVRLDGVSARLVNGSATLRVMAPLEPGFMSYRVEYPGSAYVSPANASLTIRVVPPLGPLFQAPPAPAVALLAPDSDFAWVGFVAIAILASVALYLAWAGWRRRGLARAGGAGTGALAGGAGGAVTGLAPRWGTLVSAFASLVVWLIGTGLARPSSTAREVASTLKARFDVESSAMVAAFERARYGGRRETTDPSRITAWFRHVRSRIEDGSQERPR